MKPEPTTKKIRSPIDGELVEAEIMEIDREKNSAIILHLKDGAVLRLKTDIAQVLRIPGGYGEHDEPYYRVQSSNVLSLIEFSDDHPI